MPHKWPKELKKNCVDTLNKIRLTFNLRPFKDYTILIIFILLIVFIIGAFFLFKFYTAQQAYSAPATGLPTQLPA